MGFGLSQVHMYISYLGCIGAGMTPHSGEKQPWRHGSREATR
jgi:hypothetical protein